MKEPPYLVWVAGFSVLKWAFQGNPGKYRVSQRTGGSTHPNGGRDHATTLTEGPVPQALTPGPGAGVGGPAGRGAPGKRRTTGGGGNQRWRPGEGERGGRGKEKGRVLGWRRGARLGNTGRGEERRPPEFFPGRGPGGRRPGPGRPGGSGAPRWAHGDERRGGVGGGEETRGAKGAGGGTAGAKKERENHQKKPGTPNLKRKPMFQKKKERRPRIISPPGKKGAVWKGTAGLGWGPGAAGKITGADPPPRVGAGPRGFGREEKKGFFCFFKTKKILKTFSI